MLIATLENISFQIISDAFNDAFSNYFFPVQFSAEQFVDKFASEGGRLDLSVGTFDNNKLVGFILHFEDAINGKKVIYNGGTGVSAKYRGHRLTTKMYDFIMPKLKVANIDKMVLEVLTQNHSAAKVYKNRGFKIIRELVCFKGKLNFVKLDELEASYSIVKLENLEWHKLQTFWDYPPTWQNSISTVNNLSEHNLQIGILNNQTLIAYLIYNLKSKRIYQMAIDKTYRNKGMANHLLNYLYTIEQGDISFINIDTRMAHFEAFLVGRGLRFTASQYEMEWNLN